MTAPATPGEARRWRLMASPHMQVGETRRVQVPASKHVQAHTDYLATTACDQEMTITLVTRQAERVRCPDCRVKINPDRQVMTYRAANEFGSVTTGRVAFTRAELAEQVQHWYDAGWRALDVRTADDVQVAAIGQPAGERTWWSES